MYIVYTAEAPMCIPVLNRSGLHGWLVSCLTLVCVCVCVSLTSTVVIEEDVNEKSRVFNYTFMLDDVEIDDVVWQLYQTGKEDTLVA